MNEPIPDFKDKNVIATAKRILEKPKEEDEVAEAIASLTQYAGWARGLKPYIEARIERLKEMSEVNFDGNEKVEDVGFRFLVCSSIAKELQDILTRVEATTKVVEGRRNAVQKRKTA